MRSEGKVELSLSDFETNPVWYFDDEADRHFPIETLNEPVQSIDHFRFRAEFTNAAGDFFEGCISGLGDAANSFFRNGRWYTVNRDWLTASRAQIQALIDDTPALRAKSPQTFFPVAFKTRIEREPFVEQSGLFDLSSGAYSQ